jgi:hypothetical protein
MTDDSIFGQWMDEWQITARLHGKWAQICNLAHLTLVMPAVVLPMVLSQSDVRPEVGYLSCSALVGVMSFLNLAALAQRHRLSQHLYTALYNDLSAEMARPEEARRPGAFAVADFKGRAQQALMAGPSVPMSCLWPFQRSK